MKSPFMIVLLLMMSPALAQHRCSVGGKIVVQSEPCVSSAPGKFRCYVDGEVIFSERSCSTIKSKDQLAAEEKDRARKAKELADAEVARRLVEAVKLEAADEPNFLRRTIEAKRVTAQRLRDPSSARFDGALVSWFSGSAAVCGVVAGRNGFGGYSQPVRFVAIGSWVELDSDDYKAIFDNHWNKYCGPLPR